MDKDLIEKCKNGDRIAMEQLYNHYAPKMKGICLRYSKSEYEAEDVFQEAFIKVLLKINNYQFKGSFDGWIKRIVVNTAIDHLKKDYNFKKQVSCEEADGTESSNIDVTDMLSANELLEIIKKIPAGYNAIFNLYAIEGYSHSEISEMLNISESASRSQLCKARNYIKNILHQYNFVNNEEKSSRES